MAKVGFCEWGGVGGGWGVVAVCTCTTSSLSESLNGMTRSWNAQLHRNMHFPLGYSRWEVKCSIKCDINARRWNGWMPGAGKCWDFTHRQNVSFLYSAEKFWYLNSSQGSRQKCWYFGIWSIRQGKYDQTVFKFWHFVSETHSLLPWNFLSDEGSSKNRYKP